MANRRDKLLLLVWSVVSAVSQVKSGEWEDFGPIYFVAARFGVLGSQSQL